jgi:hypothetical protein
MEIDKLIQDLDFNSDKISTQIRVVSIGLLVFAWTVLVGESAFLHKISDALGKRLLLIAALSIGVLLLDFLQYVTGYFNTLKVVRAAEEAAKTHAELDRNSTLYRFRDYLFWAKQIVLIGETVYFIVIIAAYLSG